MQTLLLGRLSETQDRAVTPAQLLRALRLPEQTFSAALSGLQRKVQHSVLRERKVLPALACATLRAAVDEAVQSGEKSCGADTVDGAISHQLNLSADRLRELIDVGGMAALGAVAQRFEALQGEAVAQNGNSSDEADSIASSPSSSVPGDEVLANFLTTAEQTEGVEIFVRRYSNSGRCVWLAGVLSARKSALLSLPARFVHQSGRTNTIVCLPNLPSRCCADHGFRSIATRRGLHATSHCARKGASQVGSYSF